MHAIAVLHISNRFGNGVSIVDNTTRYKICTVHVVCTSAFSRLGLAYSSTILCSWPI